MTICQQKHIKFIYLHHFFRPIFAVSRGNIIIFVLLFKISDYSINLYIINKKAPRMHTGRFLLTGNRYIILQR